MKSLLLFFISAMLFSSVILAHVPDKTLCIKHPEAEQLNQFLKKNQTLFVEIKGDDEYAVSLVNVLSKEQLISSVSRGKKTGDFHGLHLTFKKGISEESFKKLLKKAGVVYLKINNQEPLEL